MYTSDNYEAAKHTAGVEQAKYRRRAYGTYTKSVAEFSESWGAEISRGGC